ncbi:MAG TPA: acetyl-CoA C-acetyltransferase [Rummeliibacillus sp.]|nr:acetyl-CoA C-acetyltransferase [Rummeliibacillus sp.]
MEAYIVNGSRTAFGSFGGAFKDTSDIDLAVATVKETIERSDIDTSSIDEIIMGNIIHTSRSSAYLARHIGLKSGLSESSTALTVNRLCGSGLQAIVTAAQNIVLGETNVAIAGGTENMSLAPHVLRGTRFGTPNKAPKVDDMLFETLYDQYAGCGMGITAENLAVKYEIPREEQDQFALNSHQKAAKAIESGRFAEEIVPIVIKDKKNKEIIVDQDEHVRKEIVYDKLKSLRPAFQEKGTVTAGNASGINDGAATVLVASGDYVKQHHLQPLAKIVAWGTAGVDPKIMGIGPVYAIQKALKKANLELSDIDLIELNEAFAAQSLAVIKELNLDINKVNVNGGAVALGHPVGASGARITYSLAIEMNKRNARFGVASLCIGGGQGIAIVLENQN